MPVVIKPTSSRGWIQTQAVWFGVPLHSPVCELAYTPPTSPTTPSLILSPFPVIALTFTLITTPPACRPFTGGYRFYSWLLTRGMKLGPTLMMGSIPWPGLLHQGRAAVLQTMLVEKFLGEKCPLSSGNTLSNCLFSASLDTNGSIVQAFVKRQIGELEVKLTLPRAGSCSRFG